MMPPQPPPTGMSPMPMPSPGAGGLPMPGGNPLQALASFRGGGGGNDQMMQFLTFLAGMGFDKFAAALKSLKGDQGGGARKSALGMEAQANPRMTSPNPALAQLAMLRGGAPAMPPR